MYELYEVYEVYEMDELHEVDEVSRGRARKEGTPERHSVALLSSA
ncbi:hypothetical protein [Streptomyces sp. NRRL S-646]|nr:hypothetical protein [Streptomyces sp. NRRL S-646]